ncbi:MAG TPA: trehalose-phosphatase [Burkholderiaceae bacterium]|nr:trehalose-phosphatase [Burkholderiaceae bacterium]
MSTMLPLFGPAGRRALEAALRSQPLLAFDFDGTLAPIVARPDDARVAADVSRRLDALARLRPVAVVTGRSVDDVAQRLGFAPQFIIGNHGAEDPARPSGLDASALQGLRAQLAARAAELREAGVQLEDKRLSLALHYRLAPNRHRARALIRTLLAQLAPPLRSFGGKCVINVVPAAAPDKGDAVVSLVQRAGCSVAIFVGDDLNDEPVFARARPDWLTVRVGRSVADSRAAFFLSGHSEVQVLLDEMLRALGQP